MPDTGIPEWLETVKWVFAAFLLAIAIVGPKIVGPLIERWRNTLPVSSTSQLTPMPLAIAGAVLADKDAILRLSEALNRLCDILEDRSAREEEQNQESKTREMLRRLLREMNEAEQIQRPDRERK